MRRSAGESVVYVSVERSFKGLPAKASYVSTNAGHTNLAVGPLPPKRLYDVMAMITLVKTTLL